MSQFAFLASEWPEVHEAATRAESAVYPDPRAACFYARRALELAVQWLYDHDGDLRLPYDEKLSALIFEPSFRDLVGQGLVTKAAIIKDLGNHAVHSNNKAVRESDAVTAARELFHFTFWLARHYGRVIKAADAITFDPAKLPRATPVPPQTQARLQELEAQLRERDEKLAAMAAAEVARAIDKAQLDEELAKKHAEIAAIKKANEARPDTHDYSEAQTRDAFIDLLLKEAGWTLSQTGHDTEYPVTGMPNVQGKGYVDYVLWGDDGKPLALVEAKRTTKDAAAGKQQAKLYADCLEQQFGQRPLIFYSNGYEHWLWDDTAYPARQVQGFYKKDELALLIQRRTTRKKLAEVEVSPAIVERYYQKRAIRRIGEAFEKDRDRKALVVMATGAGKTRTVIALCDLLLRANWAKRVLFLADRIALVNQAVKAFKAHLPDSAPVNLVTEREADGRIFVSTYPTMMGLIDATQDGKKRFGPGHFDLIVVDEAHRSIYQKYRAIFAYFDSLLVGLTATPKDEIDFNTYGLFDVERGVPTDDYPLEAAVSDGFLVPPQAVSVALKFPREGIKYDDLPDEEKEQWDALEWDEETGAPDQIEAAAVNKWLFNKDTVDKVLEHLMERGQKVAGGDRLGKTIIFAKNQAHAEFISQRFDANYPHLKGEFARVIHSKVDYAQSLIDDFSKPAKSPHIAISVDMLDTGIDVPEVVNLVFFKLVRSRTKFWQMMGRGTRLSPELFGPGKDKEFFYVFDFCQNLEFFSQNVAATDGALGASLSRRLFTTRLALIGALEANVPGGVVREGRGPNEVLRDEVAALLRGEVSAMNVGNFLVRPHRRYVENYATPEAWTTLSLQESTELADHLAGLPTTLDPEDEEAKRFDLLMLNLELAHLRSEPGYARLRDQVKAIAGLLEEKASIPLVQEQLFLLQDIQSDEWWEDVTVQMLDQARKRLRQLVRLIEKQKRKPLYSDFKDALGVEASMALPGFPTSDSYERFLAKTRQFLRAHEDDLTIHKLRANEPLTVLDLQQLERILAESGAGTHAHIEKAATDNQGLGLFVRSLVGLDRQAAKSALAGFIASGHYSANQINFLDIVINHLTEHGCMKAEQLYESPYTDFNPQGVAGMFDVAQVEKLILVLEEVRRRATA